MPPSEGVAAWVCSMWKCLGNIPAAAGHRCSILQGGHQPGLERGGRPCLSHRGRCNRWVHKHACSQHPDTMAVLKKALRDKRSLLVRGSGSAVHHHPSQRPGGGLSLLSFTFFSQSVPGAGIIPTASQNSVPVNILVHHLRISIAVSLLVSLTSVYPLLSILPL